MKNNFNDCLNRLLKDEGGYSNTPGDNGGPTNFGITIVDYRKYINKKGTANDVRNMSVDEAKAIYRQKYWDALGCSNLTDGVDYTVFDYGVNSGLGRPRNALKKYSHLSGVELINAINDDRTIFLKQIGVGHNAKFLKGWLSRVDRVRSHSLQLAQQNATVSKASGGIFAGLIAGLFATYQWGIAHWQECLGGAILIAILTYFIIHFIRKH